MAVVSCSISNFANRSKGGSQEMLHVSLKHKSLGRTLNDHRFAHPFSESHGGDQCRVVAPVSGDAGVGPFASRRPGVEARHGCMGATFVHPYQKIWVRSPNPLAESRPLLLVAP
jgi:hypothetical protein